MEGEIKTYPKFMTGQKVIIQPVKEDRHTPRDAAIEPFAGKTATVEDYYYIYTPDRRQVFYIYTVKLTTQDKNEVVAHEDELRPAID